MKKLLVSLAALFAVSMAASAAAPDLTGYNEVKVWSGSTAMGNWTGCVDIPGTSFADAQVGDIVCFNATADAEAQIQVADNSWSPITAEYKYKDITGDDYMTVTADIQTKLLKGIHVKGQNFTLTGVKLYTKTTQVEYNSTPVWTGSVNLGPAGEWKTLCTVTGDKLMDAVVGGAILVKLKDFVGTSSTPSQLQFCNSSEAAITPDNYYSVSGDFTFKLSSQTDLDAIKNGIKIKGQLCTVYEIDLLTPKGQGGGSTTTFNEVRIYDGPAVSSTNGWNDNAWVTIAGSKFDEAQVGDKIRFNLSDCLKDAQLQIMDNSWKNLVSIADVSGDSYLLKISDAAMLATVQKGIFVKVNNCSVNTVDLLTQTAQKTYKTTVVWNGTATDMGSWTTELDIPADGFANAQVGDKIAIKLTPAATATASSPAQLQIAAKVGATWTWTNLYPYVDVAAPDFTFSIKAIAGLTAEDVLAAIKQGGIYLKGQKCTVTEVDLLQETAAPTAISTVNSSVKKGIDMSKPYEIYTIDGRRVQNFSGNSMFILRQNGNVMKVRKVVE
jgi:hypothetical protein